jgi:ribosomal protein S18 acetylase RimI-like enzyme
MDFAVHDVRVRDLAPDEFDETLGIVVRAMFDNPMHVHVLGDDPVRRRRRVERLQGALLKSVSSRGGLLGAEHDGNLIGVLGVAQRRLGLCETVKLIVTVLSSFPPDVTLRIGRWWLQWIRRIPREPFAHIGPVAVDPHLQRQGIGGGMMRALCARLDEQNLLAYLETDKWANVQFYRQFGFETIDEAMVVGVRNWFMIRRPLPSDQNAPQR